MFDKSTKNIQREKEAPSINASTISYTTTFD